MKAFARLAWNVAALAALTVAVWLLVTAYLLYWLAYPFEPDQITWKREIPLIMQGSADWGGSNVYAAFVFGHFAFGTAGCLLLTRVMATNWSAKAEYQYYDFGKTRFTAGPPAIVGTSFKNDEHTVKAGINYRFTWGGPAVPRY